MKSPSLYLLGGRSAWIIFIRYVADEYKTDTKTEIQLQEIQC